jgi:cell division protein FtsL
MADIDLSDLWMKGIKLVLSLLIFTILCALAGGVIVTFLELRLLFSNPLESALRTIIVDTLILLAVVSK